ncbi:pseudouridine synthase [Enterococcus alcedinis]|uniref:Pseudouridine synthase n=1 Tax=Enterococcus alcedinis TaxID=1274384 RepID=A0A917JGA0_9ENTE|nr:RluA family pseudouridine synthase [Enterococcus alcedinis]MBP2102004.1 23S rRNA pseudouridine1911/1915/1917 synthase [Enterococcus alcedinis]GGI65567.1 pseudouridine synthase [Enterococcus alcedinis]
MKFHYVFTKDEKQQIKFFLKEQGVSKKLLAKIKFHGGKILVNEQEQNVLYWLQKEEVVTIIIPDEGEHETLKIDDTPIDIVFEDEHLLIVNKPPGVSSIPAQYHPNHTMANRVKAYYKRQGYVNQVVHVVTRLDRDTSGLMVFAKHGFAHSRLDEQLRNRTFHKKYKALITGEMSELKSHALFEQPIGRDLRSIIKRQVTTAGQSAQTEYWLAKKNQEIALVDIQLHTGRTHQIRVHFSANGYPLVGDDLYDGRTDLGIERQALHCFDLAFLHPFTQEALHFQQELPADMEAVQQKI